MTLNHFPERVLLEASAEDAGQRLDVFLASRLERVSRSVVQRWIEAGQVKVNDRRQRPRYAVKKGDKISLLVPSPEPSHLVAEAIPLSIVYEDTTLVVVDKPAGMVVHPGAGNRSGTLANALLHHFGQISRHDTLRPGMVHRLDKNTSGLLLVAKSEWVHDFLASQFKKREVEKQYLALLHGRLRKEQGVIDRPLGRDPWVRTRISTRSRRSRQAVTRYEVIRFLSGGGVTFSLVRVHLHTGRTHQIRVHFQSIGHPVVGDDTYGKKADQQVKDATIRAFIEELGRHFLHAASLSFTHPETGEYVSFESPLPRELAELLTNLE